MMIYGLRFKADRPPALFSATLRRNGVRFRVALYLSNDDPRWLCVVTKAEGASYMVGRGSSRRYNAVRGAVRAWRSNGSTARKRRCIERRDSDGIIERKCVKCRHWVVLEHFAKDALCFRGRTRECKDCRNKRRRVARAEARA